MSDTAQHHPLIELLARYKSVFRAAWAARHELAGPKRLADEAAFLPAALSLQETPVHPAPRRAMWVIGAVFSFAVAWSIVGQVDIVAVAQGRIVVSDSSKIVQPLEASVVKAIKVNDGDRVRRGQVLIELDATGAAADRKSVQEQLEAATGEAARSEALLQALKTGQPPQAKALPLQEAELLRSEWADISAKLAKLEAEGVRRQAELATAHQMVAKLEATLPLARQREADYQALTHEGFVAGHAQQDRSRERIELERDLATQKARVSEGQAALAETRNAKAAYLAETRRTLGDRFTQAKLKASQLTQEALKSEHREGLTLLKAPTDGTVQQLSVHTAGGVVTAAQVLMVIVPDEAQVIAEVEIANKDIGFVRQGQPAEIKLETFNFTRYGTVPATVSWVAPDAVADEKTGTARFPARLTLDRREIEVEGKAVRLTPGLNVTAEVKTGQQRLIEFLLSPIQKRVSEGGRER
ncbi:MAG: HlyD family type I secretion periplasmic adaptor subunit [Pseudomonadota bacterium]